MASGTMLTLLLTSVVTLALNTQPASSCGDVTLLGMANLAVQSSDAQAPSAEWNKTYGRQYSDIAWSVVQTSDEGYALAGTTSSYIYYDFWLVKTDSLGDMQWNQTYGGTGTDWAWSLVQTSDNGYAFAGLTTYGSDSPNAWLVKTDSLGNMQWNQTYGGTCEDSAYSLVETSDEGYAIAGYTDSSGAGGHDFWLVKIAGTRGTQADAASLAPLIYYTTAVILVVAATTIGIAMLRRHRRLRATQ